MGTWAGQRLADARAALGWCQLLAAGAIAWAAWSIATPGATFDPATVSITASFLIDLTLCARAMLPAALLWGASFPLALAARAGEGEDPARLLGTTYAANTAGAIAGALGFSIVLVPLLGTLETQRLLVALSGLAAIVVFAFEARRWKSVLVVGAVVPLIIAVKPVPWDLFGYGRHVNFQRAESKPLYVGEGTDASVVVSELFNGRRYFHVSGKVEASTEPKDMRLQRMLGHLPALVHGAPKSVLIVGFGAGVTAGSFTTVPSVEKITISEIEPLIPKVSTEYFANENYAVLKDPRTTVHYDDARHYLLTTNERFDLISSDPIHPFVKGTATLYSREYFELCKRHLNPGGVVAQWVPLYESDLDTVRTELATFFEAFPHATIWSSTRGGYDVVLIGQLEPRPIDVTAWERRWLEPGFARAAQSLADVGLSGPLEVLVTFAGRQDELAPWLQDAVINRDRDLRLQYLAGWGLNFNEPEKVFDELISRRRTAGVFVGGDPDLMARFDALLEAQGRARARRY